MTKGNLTEEQTQKLMKEIEDDYKKMASIVSGVKFEKITDDIEKVKNSAYAVLEEIEKTATNAESKSLYKMMEFEAKYNRGMFDLSIDYEILKNRLEDYKNTVKDILEV